MVMSFSSSYVEPGVYIKIVNVPAPNPVSGNFIPIFVGLGRKDYDITAGITRTNQTTDLLTDEFTVVKVLSITDSFGIVYTDGWDYALLLSGGDYFIDWNKPQSLTGTANDGGGTGFNVTGLTLKLNIDGTTATVTFSTADPISAVTVASQINAAFTGTPASVTTVGGNNFITLTGDLVSIEGGSALDELGFLQGGGVESKEPTEGDVYNVTFKRLKLTTDYTPKLFTRLEDVYAEFGPYATPSEVASGDVYSLGNTTTDIVIGASSTTPVLSGTATVTSTVTVVNISGSPDLSVVSVGDIYVGTGGTGSGETSIVTIVDDAGDNLTVSPALTTQPDATSTFNILPKTDLSSVAAGDYIKVSAGTGEGQLRVVMSSVDATNTVTVSPALDQVLDATSDVVIYDGPLSEISIAATIAQKHGTTTFMGSQSADDIVDNNNFRLAIDNTKELVSGFQGWNLIYLKGVDVNDSIVSYIKSYIAEMNGPTTKQERKALLGMKATTTSWTTVTTLTQGITDARIGVVASPFGTITGIGQLDGSYIAAAIAGIETNPANDPGEPISGKSILFDTIDDPYLRHEKRSIGQYGGIVIERQGVDYKIVHYLSTKVDDVIDSELKVIKQTDDIKKTLRNTLTATMVNTRIIGNGKNILSMADSFINLILTEKVNLGSISGYKDVEIKFNPNEPRELQIKFLYKPTFDLNWITIEFGATIQL